MPCYSRINSTIEWTEGTDATLLASALKQLGYIVGQAGKVVRFSHPDLDVSGTFDGRTGTMQVDTNTLDQNQLKRAYSAEVIKSAAKRFGWTAKQATDTQFQVTRRA